MNLQDIAKEFLNSNKLMQLATINESGPWICNVYFAFDENFNLYWTSGRDRQHSMEIVNDGRVAVSVVKDDVKKQALQIVGTASEADPDELESIHAIYTNRFGPKDYDLDEMKLGKSGGRAYWVFRPSKISLWDEVNFPESPKQSFDL